MYLTSADSAVRHRQIAIEGVEIFYREAGAEDAPVVLLPHGYPSSSFQFRGLMPALADRWRLLAPDFPGFGYSATPPRTSFAYTFDGYAELLERFADALELRRYALYLHDYGSQIGLRLAMRTPERVAALIIQNGDIYEDQLGPRYQPLQDYWADPTPERRRKLMDAVSEEGFREEFVNQVDDHLRDRISPDLWKLSWPLMRDPRRREISVGLMEGLKENLEWFPRYQAYLRKHRPPTLIVWGPQDGYMPEGAARAYLRDLPDAELHLLEAGHWALETNLEEIVALMRNFLGRVHRPEPAAGLRIVETPTADDSPNVEVVRRAFAAISRGDIPAFLETLDEDVEWLLAMAGRRRGRQQVAEWLSALGRAEEVQELEVRDFITQGEKVVVLGRSRVMVRTTGRTNESSWMHVYTLRGGKIVKFRECYDTAGQLAAHRAGPVRPD